MKSRACQILCGSMALVTWGPGLLAANHSDSLFQSRQLDEEHGKVQVLDAFP